jgi:hypothetical protein
VTETIAAGTLRLDIQIDRTPAWAASWRAVQDTETDSILTGQEFVFPCGWAAFSELLGLTLYTRHPEALQHGHQGERVMFSAGERNQRGFFGIDGLRIFAGGGL